MGVRNAELKFYDRQLLTRSDGLADANSATIVRWRLGGATLGGAYANIMTTGAVYSTGTILDKLSCGTNAHQRIGRKIVIKSLMLDLCCFANMNKQEKAQTFKMWLVLDKQCNGEAEVGSNFLCQPAGLPGNITAAGLQREAYNCTQMPNIANRQRFQILKEWRWTQSPTCAIGSNDAEAIWSVSTKWIKHYQKLNLPIEYGGTDGDVGEIKSNNLFLCICSNLDNAQTTTQSYVIGGAVRIRYNDS